MTGTHPMANTPTLASHIASLSGNAEAAIASLSPDAIDLHQGDAMADLIKGFDRIPRVLDGFHREPSRAYLEASGFHILGDADDLFLRVAPPSGWWIAPAWTDTVAEVRDDKGRLRFHVSYKAAHYDRHAEVRPACRYKLGMEFIDDAGKPTNVLSRMATAVSVVMDSDGSHPYRGEPVKNVRLAASPGERGELVKLMEAEEARARAWLDATHPDWRDPAACWDTP